MMESIGVALTILAIVFALAITGMFVTAIVFFVIYKLDGGKMAALNYFKWFFKNF